LKEIEVGMGLTELKGDRDRQRWIRKGAEAGKELKG